MRSVRIKLWWTEPHSEDFFLNLNPPVKREISSLVVTHVGGAWRSVDDIGIRTCIEGKLREIKREMRE